MTRSVREVQCRAAIDRISVRREENLSVVGDGLDGWTRLGGIGSAE